jgi:hypothetical protein
LSFCYGSLSDGRATSHLHHTLLSIWNPRHCQGSRLFKVAQQHSFQLPMYDPLPPSLTSKSQDTLSSSTAAHRGMSYKPKKGQYVISQLSLQTIMHQSPGYLTLFDAESDPGSITADAYPELRYNHPSGNANFPVVQINLSHHLINAQKKSNRKPCFRKNGVPKDTQHNPNRKNLLSSSYSD